MLVNCKGDGKSDPPLPARNRQQGRIAKLMVCFTSESRQWLEQHDLGSLDAIRAMKIQ